MYKQGDVILVPFPFSDLSGSKLRPALVISSEQVNQTRDLICVQITSKVFNDFFFFELNDNDVIPKLPLKSGIRLHKIFTVEQNRIERKLGELTPKTLETVLVEIQTKVL
ncbi:MAG TPA: type II toxin-antitoxin system PemK/MazF family toxin [Chitinophagales bacterium]